MPRPSTLKVLLFAAVLVNFSGLFVDLMDPDAGVYASISKNMVLSNDWLSLQFQGKDWLDKPHFPFWITAVFFKVFGFHTWAYKLPGILFVLMGACYTYLFARRFYSERIGLWSAFILLTAVHIIISNNDVRAEPYLTGLIIASIYHLSCAIRKGINYHLLLGCLFAAFAMMTKGLFTLAPIAAAIGGHLLITRQWKEIFHWRWLLASLLILIFISPELYALWYQFDSHPEKILYGKTNVSGIRFFLWDSQFGRFMNTGPIKGKGDLLFFIHTLLWAFLPWCLLMYAALFKKIRLAFAPGEKKNTEWFTLAGSLFTLLIFSVSKFQLPYYTNIIFPLLAILTAEQVERAIQNQNRKWPRIQNALSIIISLLATALYFYFRPPLPLIPVILFIAGLIILIFVTEKAAKVERPYLRSASDILIVALFLNLLFYPRLLQYQSGNQAAFYINRNYPATPIGRINFYMPSGEFYLDQPVTAVDSITIRKGTFPKGGLVYVSGEEKSMLDKAGIIYETIREFSEYHVTMLTLKFLNPKTREQQLKKYFLIRLR